MLVDCSAKQFGIVPPIRLSESSRCASVVDALQSGSRVPEILLLRADMVCRDEFGANVGSCPVNAFPLSSSVASIGQLPSHWGSVPDSPQSISTRISAAGSHSEERVDSLDGPMAADVAVVLVTTGELKPSGSPPSRDAPESTKSWRLGSLKSSVGIGPESLSPPKSSCLSARSFPMQVGIVPVIAVSPKNPQTHKANADSQAA